MSTSYCYINQKSIESIRKYNNKKKRMIICLIDIIGVNLW